MFIIVCWLFVRVWNFEIVIFDFFSILKKDSDFFGVLCFIWLIEVFCGIVFYGIGKVVFFLIYSVMFEFLLFVEFGDLKFC